MNRFYLFILFMLAENILAAQSQNKGLYYGNKNYKEGNFKEAEENYLKAYEPKKNREAQYNLGNALYQQKNFDGAAKHFGEVATVTKDPSLKSSANYNLGNTFMEKKNWGEAIKAYKESLKSTPSLDAAKYNLAYAQKMKQQEEEQKKQQKDQQSKDKKNQESAQDPNKEKENKNQNNQPDKGDQDKPKPMPSKLTKEQANQILNALNQEEKKLKQKKERGNGIPVPLEKDW